MATVFTPLYNNQDDDKQDGPASLSNASGPAGGGPNASAAAPKGSGQATNLQNYIKANIGGGDQIAQGIQNKVQNQSDQFGQGIQKAQSELQDKSNPLEAELGDDAKNVIKTSFQDPQALLGQQNQLSQFQRLRDQGANSDIHNIQNQQGQLSSQLHNSAQFNNINASAQNAGNEAGQFQLLQQTFGNPTYSSGQQRLDQLLLQAQPNSARGLQQGLGQIRQGANQQIQGLDANSQAKIAALQNMSKQNSTDIQGLLNTGQYQGEKLGEGFDDLQKNANQRLLEAKANASVYQDLPTHIMNPAQLTSNELDLLGLTSGQSKYGVGLGSYVQNMNLNPTMAQAGNPQDYARYEALRQLSANAPADMYGGVPADQIGVYHPFDLTSKEGLKSEIAQKQQDWETGSHLQDALNANSARFHYGSQDQQDYYAPYNTLNDAKSGEDLYQRLQALKSNSSLNANDPNWMPEINDYLTELFKMRGDKVGNSGQTPMEGIQDVINNAGNGGWTPPTSK